MVLFVVVVLWESFKGARGEVRESSAVGLFFFYHGAGFTPFPLDL